MPLNRGIRGVGRRSGSLGERDPRSYRLSQVLGSTIPFDETIRINRRGEIGVRAARGVPNLKPGEDIETVIARVNSLMESLREAGLLEE